MKSLITTAIGPDSETNTELNEFLQKEKKETPIPNLDYSFDTAFVSFYHELNDPLRTFITFIQFQVSTKKNFDFNFNSCELYFFFYYVRFAP